MNRKYISTIAISLTIMSMALVGCNSSDEDISKVLKDTTVTKSNEESNKKEVKNNLSLQQLDKLKSDDMLQEGINKEKLKESMNDFADSIYKISNEAKAKAGQIKNQVNNVSDSMKKLNNNKNKAENSLSRALDGIQSNGILGKISNESEKGRQVRNNLNDVSDKIEMVSSNIDDFKNNAGNILAEGKQNINGLTPMVRADLMSIRNDLRADIQRNIDGIRNDARQDIQSSLKEIRKDLREDAQHNFNTIRGDVKNYIQANSNGIKKDFKEELDKNIQGIRNDIRQDVQKNINDIGTDVKAHIKDNQNKMFSKINETQNSINNFLGQIIKSKKS